MSNLQFRVATEADVPIIRGLVEASFRATDPRPGWTAGRALSEDFTVTNQFVANTVLPTATDREWLVACDEEGKIIGCCTLRLCKPGLTRLGMLSVDTTLQRGGFGKEIVLEAENFCRKRWSAERMELNALSIRERLIEWYERQGYCKTGEVEVENVPVHGELRFVVLEKKI